MLDQNEKIGATIWARQTIDSEIFFNKPDKWFKIWFYLVNRVNHKKNRNWNRGECHITYNEICQSTGAKYNTVDHCFRWLKSARMLTTQKATRGMHLKIVKYDYFQDFNNYKSDKKSETEAKQKRDRSDTRNNNVNNEKNERMNVRGNKFPGQRNNSFNHIANYLKK